MQRELNWNRQTRFFFLVPSPTYDIKTYAIRKRYGGATACHISRDTIIKEIQKNYKIEPVLGTCL